MQESPYPLNENGDPEYASIVVTFDHLSQRDDHHILTKFVGSTQEAEASLAALFDYYNEPHIGAAQSTREIISNGYGKDAIYFYVTPGLAVQAVMSTVTLQKLVHSPLVGKGSLLVAIDKIKGWATQAIEDGKVKRGDSTYPPLTMALCEWLTTPAAAPEEIRPDADVIRDAEAVFGGRWPDEIPTALAVQLADVPQGLAPRVESDESDEDRNRRVEQSEDQPASATRPAVSFV